MSQTRGDTKTVHIVGAGFSGLTTAYFLQKAGCRVVLHEESSEVGGLIQTRTLQSPDGRGSALVETGANGFLASQLIEEVCADIGVDLQSTLKSAKKRFIYFEGMKRWPLSFFESLVFTKAVFLALFAKEKIIPVQQETIAQWAERIWGPNWGQKIKAKLLLPALRGIYAGDVEVLSASLILGPVLKARLVKGKLRGTVSPVGGMSVFMEKLQAYLQSHGANLFFKQPVSSEEIKTWLAAKEICVIATSAKDITKLIPQFPQSKMLPVIRSTVLWPEATKRLGGFGVLFADGQNYRSLGVLSNSDIFADASQGGISESWILGGAKDENILDLSDENLKSLIEKERANLLGEALKIESVYFAKWPQGLPHYTITHEKNLQEFAAERMKLESEGIFLAGNYLGVLGLSRIIKDNQETAARVLSTQTFAAKESP